MMNWAAVHKLVTKVIWIVACGLALLFVLAGDTDDLIRGIGCMVMAAGWMVYDIHDKVT